MVDRQRGRSNDPIIGEITIELKKAQLIFIRHAKNFPSLENPTKILKISTVSYGIGRVKPFV